MNTPTRKLASGDTRFHSRVKGAAKVHASRVARRIRNAGKLD